MSTGNSGVGPATLLFGLMLGVLALNGTNALPLIEEDKLALVALIQGVVPPPEGAPSMPPTWGTQDVPSICDTHNFTEITCDLFNSTHSTVTQFAYPTHFFWRMLPGIKNFRSIKILYLSNFVLVGPIIPELGQLTTLQDLVLIDSGVKERPTEWLRHPPIPSEIGDLLDLRRLCIVGMLINGTAPSSISRLTLLTDLSLRGNLLTSPLPNLSGMRDLLKLDVSSNLFSEPFPSYFGEFSALTDLYADTNNFNGTIPIFSQRNISAISIGDNLLSGGISSGLTRLPKLKDLNIEYNQLSGPLPGEWSPSLRTILLAGNKFTGRLPDGLSNLNASALRELDVSDNSLTDSLEQKSWLAQFSGLTKLHLGGNDWGSSSIPLWINSSSFPSLKSLRLHDGGFVGDVPRAVSTMPGLETLDVSDNFLNCPNYTVPSRQSNLWHGNYFCADGPDFTLQPSCASVPESGRFTPCRREREETLLTGVCTGELLVLDSAIVPSGAALLYDPCHPRFRLQLTTTTGSVWTELDITQLGDCNSKTCLATWSTETIPWQVYLSYIKTKNNSFVPEVSYRGTLPNGASFQLPFWYFARGDSLKLYESWLPVEPATVKFGLEVRRFKKIQSLRDVYMGMDVEVRTSEPVLVQSNFLEFVASLSNGSISSSFGLEFTKTKGVLNFRVPLLGQTDQKINIGGVFNSETFNKTEMVLKIVNSEPIQRLTIPLRLKVGDGRLLSYDPDLALLLDPSALQILPTSSPMSVALEASSSTVGIAVGVSAAVAALVAGILIIVFVVKRRMQNEDDQRRLQEKLNQRNQEAATERLRTGTTSAPWRTASIPTSATNT